MAATTNPEYANRETTFDLLSSPVRRALVSVLYESESVERERLTEMLATTDSGGDEDSRRRIRIALHHNHLPRLAEAGVLVYDDETVTATGQLKTLVSEMASLAGTDRAFTRA